MALFCGRHLICLWAPSQRQNDYVQKEEKVGQKDTKGYTGKHFADAGSMIMKKFGTSESRTGSGPRSNVCVDRQQETQRHQLGASLLFPLVWSTADCSIAAWSFVLFILKLLKYHRASPVSQLWDSPSLCWEKDGLQFFRLWVRVYPRAIIRARIPKNLRSSCCNLHNPFAKVEQEL